jgi:hypothetical protein
MKAMQPKTQSTPPGARMQRVALCHALLLLPLWLASPVLAQGERSPPVLNNLVEPAAEQPEDETRTRISRRTASDLAREAFPGRVLNIRLESRHWRVRMDQEGTVFNVLVDADSGDVARSQD